MNKKSPKTPRGTVVLYHADCADGFGAAWAAWKKLGKKAAYIPVPPSNRELPSIAEGKHVITLDYSFPADAVEGVLKKVASLTVLDHHATNAEAAARATASSFDLTHSGAVISWKYFHPDKKIPRMLLHIEDYDLWKFALSKTRELIEAILQEDMNFEEWDKLVRGVENKEIHKRYVMEGAALLRRMEKRVGRLASSAEEVNFEGHKALMVNSPFYTSEVGHALVRKGAPVAIIWSRRGKKVIVSLRSSGKVDVARLAERYGGGGHKAAAGFSFEAPKLVTFKKSRKNRKKD